MILKLYQEHHLGDHVHTLHYIRKLLLSNNEYIIYYYINFIYLNELIKIIEPDLLNRIIFKKYDEYNNDGVKTWLGYYPNHSHLLFTVPHEIFFINVFDRISKLLNVENPIKTQNDFLMDSPNLLIPNILSDTYDFLIINSNALSGQLYMDDESFGKIIDYLHSKNYKIITTKKYKNYLCTTDFGLNLNDIGNLSLTTKIIISVHTSPMILTINKWSINTVDKWLLLCKNNITYDYNNKFKLINTVSNALQYIKQTY